MTVAEQILLGAVQGLVEWFPVSSEGVLVLVQSAVLNVEGEASTLIGNAVALHLGTVLAALIYFWEDYIDVLRAATGHDTRKEPRVLLSFLAVSTILTGVVGYPLLQGIHIIESQYAMTGDLLTAGIGVLLLLTAVFLYFGGHANGRSITGTTILDSIVTGIAQGFAILPGVSRSGITVSTLLLRSIDDEAALKLSFLMSAPAVIGGNILFQLDGFTLAQGAAWGMAAAFITGIAAIHVLLAVARRVDFTYFVAVFGAAMLAAALL